LPVSSMLGKSDKAGLFRSGIKKRVPARIMARR
jgi:hypothetical protein